MCLDLTKGSKRLVAEEDIICYKLMKKSDVEGEYFTYFQHCAVTLNQECTSELIVNESNYNSFGIINIGLHTFKTKSGCLRMLRKASDSLISSMEKCVILKCIIPKGSEYYQGNFGVTIAWQDYDFKSYASNCIKYIEEVTN